MPDEVTLVIPVWNGADLLNRLLATVSRQTLQPVEVLAINNASTDKAVEVARRWGARVIHMSRNAGFAAAANRGISEAKTSWVALVNSDVELAPDWVSILTHSAVKHEAAFAAGKILNAGDTRLMDGAWDLVARSGCAWRAGKDMSEGPQFDIGRRVAFLSATATLYHRSVFDRVGPFAEDYESYLEDVDFSLRCAAAGFHGYYDPGAVSLHHGSASFGIWSDRATWLMARNQSLLRQRLYPAELRKEWRRPIVIGNLLWGLLAARHGRLPAWLRGKWAARSLRAQPLALDLATLKRTIIDSEAEIRALQGDARDLYWRLYFGMTGLAT